MYVSDITQDGVRDNDDAPTSDECTNEYDDNEVSVSFAFIVFSPSLVHDRDFSVFWVVDSSCSINLTAFSR
jgi:hypothetical protein